MTEVRTVAAWQAKLCARLVADHEPFTLHFWIGQRTLTFAVRDLCDFASFQTNGRGWRVDFGPRYSGTCWADVFMIATADLRHIDPARIYDLPVRLAKELAEEEPLDRSGFEIIDTVKRALKRGWGFGRAFYTPPSWETRQRAEDTRRKLREVEMADAVDAGVVCAYAAAGYLVERTPERPSVEETEALFDYERAHLGVDRLAGTVVDPRSLPGAGR